MPSLLKTEEPPVYRTVDGGSDLPLLLVCDHASNRVPLALAGLGLDPALLETHSGCDLGIAAVTERLCRTLRVDGLFTGYSRLVIDCNRGPGAADLIPPVSDGVDVPGNVGLSEAEIRLRQQTFLEPYQQAVAAKLQELDARWGRPVHLIAMHSFTPQLRVNGSRRPWQIGVLWREDRATAEKLIAWFEKEAALCVGDNEPYSMQKATAYTLARHGEGQRANALIEVRQDELASQDGQDRYVDFLTAALRSLF